jgi:3-hydroxybutyryl-CoA dehydrogenase
MKKIFIIGEPAVNDELKNALGANTEITDYLDNSIDVIFETANFPKEKKYENIRFIDENSSSKVPVFSSSLCMPVYEQSAISKYPHRIIGTGIYNTFSNAKLLEIAPSKITGSKILENAESFLKEINLNYAKVPDRAGLVFPRILSMIINEAVQVYSENTATRDDIDTAMKLGTNYPFGPLEWADKLGNDLVYNILIALQPIIF